jgi:hypothetical protein
VSLRGRPGDNPLGGLGLNFGIHDDEGAKGPPVGVTGCWRLTVDCGEHLQALLVSLKRRPSLRTWARSSIRRRQCCAKATLWNSQ